MDIRKRKFVGFSLAEALITLLIISLIALASVPVITKKHRLRTQNETKSTEHGKWICAINSNGQHVYWQTGDANYDNIDNWKAADNYGYCTFDVPKGGKNFSITATGGGGGGASAQKEIFFKSGSDYVPIKYYGKYRMVAIGAGGSGGDSNCNSQSNYISGGGGAGGVGFLEMNLTETTKGLMLTKGEAVAPADYTGKKGGDSKITRELTNQTTQVLLQATGGKGGEGRWRNSVACNDGTAKGGAQGSVTGVPTVKSYNSTEKQRYNNNKYIGEGISECQDKPCNGYVDINDRKLLNEALGYKFIEEDGKYYEHKGAGGQAGSCDNVASGPVTCNKNAFDGGVVVYTEIYHSGGGGKAGGVVSKQFYPSLEKSKYKVMVGYGGDGANNGNGMDGTYTVVEDLIQVPGGIGGAIITEKGVALTEIAGGDGEESRLYYKDSQTKPFGGLSGDNVGSIDGMMGSGFGAGGGGGGMKEGAALGSGADGRNGIVIIEW